MKRRGKKRASRAYPPEFRLRAVLMHKDNGLTQADVARELGMSINTLNTWVLAYNLPFEQWTEVMGSERLTGALLDRLTHRVHIIEANGESYRLKDARKRRKPPGGGRHPAG